MSLGFFTPIYEGLVGAFGTPWLVLAFVAIGVIGLISVTVRLNPLISIALASLPFLIFMLYIPIQSTMWPVVSAVLVIGLLVGTAIYQFMNR